MADKHPEWFNTPMLKYLAMKKEFLNTFAARCEWGQFGTEQQVIALSRILDYFERTRNLAENFPTLKDEIIMENKNLIIERKVLIPDKLYEELIWAIVEGAQKEYQNIWQQPTSVTLVKIQKFLKIQKGGCLALYQCRMWSEVDSCSYPDTQSPDSSIREAEREKVTKAKSHLRKMRNFR